MMETSSSKIPSKIYFRPLNHFPKILRKNPWVFMAGATVKPQVPDNFWTQFWGGQRRAVWSFFGEDFFALRMQIFLKGSMKHTAGGDGIRWESFFRNDLISGVNCFLLPFIRTRSEIYGRSSCLAYSKPQDPGFRKLFKRYLRLFWVTSQAFSILVLVWV